uniref:Uncharacterized protein n=1 Tax=Rhizophora mucronata TaxID=61149 RepID=A0A2P2L6G4_RHIMU
MKSQHINEHYARNTTKSCARNFTRNVQARMNINTQKELLGSKIFYKTYFVIVPSTSEITMRTFHFHK